jgi:hypothetical protein
MRKLHAFWLLLVGPVAVAVFAQSSAQSGGSAPAQTTDPKIKVETRIVLVDVVVTGAKGDPMSARVASENVPGCAAAYSLTRF